MAVHASIIKSGFMPDLISLVRMKGLGVEASLLALPSHFVDLATKCAEGSYERKDLSAGKLPPPLARNKNS